ncbi:MAG: hypothetical protein ACMG6E_02485 [Candidatus Roizmanbacteria bacterium]
MQKSNCPHKQTSFLKSVQSIAMEDGVDGGDQEITLETNFESMCYGKGKTDDITVSAMWISRKY